MSRHSHRAILDDEVHVDDVLRSMAESLLEEQSYYKVPQLPNIVPLKDSPVKPNQDIFYRKNPLYMKKPPANISQRRCSCMYLCTGATAIIKCVSCAALDINGVGYYCQLCFNARHPWHRVPHVFMNIEQDEEIAYSRKHAMFKTDMLRCENEGKQLLKTLKHQKAKLDIVGDDEKIDDSLRYTGRKMCDVENRIKLLQEELRNDIQKSHILIGNSNTSNGNSILLLDNSASNTISGSTTMSLLTNISDTHPYIELLIKYKNWFEMWNNMFYNNKSK